MHARSKADPYGSTKPKPKAKLILVLILGNRVVSTNVQFLGHFDLVLITARAQYILSTTIDVIVALDCGKWRK